jgi:hypothetical protein
MNGVVTRELAAANIEPRRRGLEALLADAIDSGASATTPPTPTDRSPRARSSISGSRSAASAPGANMADVDADKQSARMGHLAPRALFYSRVARAAAVSLCLVAATLAIGTFGYMEFAGLRAIDAFHLASLLLSGMGPVGEVDKFSDAAKLFDSLYALFCGVVLVASVGVLFAPIIHRLLHRFHLEDTRD